LSKVQDGKALDNFTISKAHISNKGTDIIHRSDVAPSEPLRFSTDFDTGEAILDYTILFANDRTINPSIERIDEKTIELGFDFFEPKDKVIVQILHTGKNSGSILVSGKIIGAKKPFIPDVDYNVSPHLRLLQKHPVLFIFILRLFIAAMSAVISYFIFTKIQVLGLVCFLPTAFLLYKALKIAIKPPDKTLEKTGFGKDVLLEAMQRAFTNMDEEIS
jgi:hypothetical protein